MSTEKEIGSTVDLGDAETTVRIGAKNGRLTILDILAALSNIQSKLALEASKQINQGNKELLVVDKNGLILSAIPFGADKHEESDAKSAD